MKAKPNEGDIVVVTEDIYYQQKVYFEKDMKVLIVGTFESSDNMHVRRILSEEDFSIVDGVEVLTLGLSDPFITLDEYYNCNIYIKI